jgi:transcriptional repressor NrdR
LDDKVVDSRLAEGGISIRRRRQCLTCGGRFTTFERSEPAGLRVLKRSGEIEPYEREKVVGGLVKACKNRPVSEADIERLADEIEERLREGGRREVPSAEVGLATLDRLREVDEVAYIRFASVYRDFDSLTDFEKEVGLLLDKQTPPKQLLQKD